MSRRYGGIHFESADLAGRLLGNLATLGAWSKAQNYFDGTAKPLKYEDTTATEASVPHP